MRTLLAVLRGLLLAGGPVFTLVACVGLLLLGVHAAAQPVAHLARGILDGVDAGADALGALCIKAYGAALGWRAGTVEDAVERFEGLLDVPEKLALVHALALLLELVLAAALLPVAWHARPWTVDRWNDPAARVKAWWLGLPRWVRLERTLLLPWVLVAVWRVASMVRVNAVALGSAHVADVAALGSAGWVALWATVALVTWHAALPLGLSSPEASLRAGRWRRLTTLTLAPLGLMALVEAVLW